MGVDFISKAKKAFRKGLDQSRVELGTPNLFSRDPEEAPRSYSVTLRGGRKLETDQQVCVRLQGGGGVVAMDGFDVIGEFDAPPAELVEALEASAGDGWGTVVTMHEAAGVAEMTVC